MGREHGDTTGPAVIDRPIVGSASAQMAPNAPEVVIQRARRRRRRRRAFAALALAGAVGLIAGLAAVFSSSPPNLPPNASPKAIAPRSHPILPTVTRSADGLVSWRGPMHSSRVFDTSIGLYFSWVTTWPGYGHRHGVLARVDPLTGAFIVVRSLRGWPAQAVAVDHSLFVGLTSQTSKVSGGRLVRMDPATLRIIRSWSLPAGTNLTSMVIAGGGLWIGRGDTLHRLTPTRGTVTSSLRLPSAVRVSLGTNGQGSVLVASADNPTGGYYLERVDPSTGAVELKSTLKIGDAAIGGIVQTAVWLSVATGTMGSVSLYDVRTLQPVGPRCHTGVSTQSEWGATDIRDWTTVRLGGAQWARQSWAKECVQEVVAWAVMLAICDDGGACDMHRCTELLLPIQMSTDRVVFLSSCSSHRYAVAVAPAHLPAFCRSTVARYSVALVPVREPAAANARC